MNKVVACLLLASLAFAGCSQSPVKKPLNINYEIVDTYSNDFDADMELKQWYLDNYKTKGKNTKNYAGKTYILVSMGEKRSGGYVMEVVKIVATDKIIVNTQITEPNLDQVNTMILTYPHLLIAIPQDDRNIIWENSIKSR